MPDLSSSHVIREPDIVAGHQLKISTPDWFHVDAGHVLWLIGRSCTSRTETEVPYQELGIFESGDLGPAAIAKFYNLRSFLIKIANAANPGMCRTTARGDGPVTAAAPADPRFRQIKGNIKRLSVWSCASGRGALKLVVKCQDCAVVGPAEVSSRWRLFNVCVSCVSASCT